MKLAVTIDMFTIQGAAACCHSDNNESLWVTSIQMTEGEKQQATLRTLNEFGGGIWHYVIQITSILQPVISLAHNKTGKLRK